MNWTETVITEVKSNPTKATKDHSLTCATIWRRGHADILADLEDSDIDENCFVKNYRCATFSNAGIHYIHKIGDNYVVIIAPFSCIPYKDDLKMVYYAVKGIQNHPIDIMRESGKPDHGADTEIEVIPTEYFVGHTENGGLE